MVESRAMSVRRLATWVSTAVVAIVVALAVPVSQLRLLAVVASCCCPDPDNCHCPDHTPDHGDQAKLKQCHRSADTIESAAASSVALVVRSELVPQRTAAVVHHVIVAPHTSPFVERPRGPS